jgi:hypothetical protein
MVIAVAKSLQTRTRIRSSDAMRGLATIAMALD